MADALWALAAVASLTTGVWVISLLARDASLIDLFWGPLFAVQAWVHWSRIPEPGPEKPKK